MSEINEENAGMFNKKRLITAAVLVVATIMIVIAVTIIALMLFRSSSNTVAMPGATAVGVPNGPATTKSIGPAGGSIASPDGRITVDVPPNAVSSPVDFSIQSITNLAHGGVGSAYRLEPGGQKFAPPIEVSFKFDAQDLKGYSPEALAIAYQDPTGVWQSFRTVNIDQASKTLTVSTTHFTDLSVWTIRLSPEKATLRVGETQLIAVEGCIEKDGWGSKLKTLLGTQSCQFFMPRENSWSVNVGTIAMVPGAVLYTAPAKKPFPNVATVRLVYRLRGSSPNQKDVRTCEITIIDGGYEATGSDGPTSYSGTVCSLDKEFTVVGHSGGLALTFAFTPSGEGRTGTGSLVGSYGIVTWTGGGPYKIEGFDSEKPKIVWVTHQTVSPVTSGSGTFHIDLVPIGTDECTKK
jgi:hypothetical protein